MLNSKASFAFSLLVPAPMRTSILAATLIAMTAGMIPLATPADAAEMVLQKERKHELCVPDPGSNVRRP